MGRDTLAVPWPFHKRERRGVTFLSGALTVVESEAFHITNSQVDNAPVEVPTPSRIGVSRPYPFERRKTPPVLRARFGLQRRGQVNFRRHLLRALRRFAVLLTTDLASFYVMRELVRAVRDE